MTEQSAYQNCGLAPNTTYTRNFADAEAVIQSSSRSWSGDFGLTIPTDGLVPVMGNGSVANQEGSASQMVHSVTDAETIIRNEAQSEKPAMVAECGYAMCLLGTDSSPENLLRAQFTGQICMAAMVGDASGGSLGDEDIRILPATAVVVFDKPEMEYTALVERKASGAVRIEPQVLGSDYVVYNGTNQDGFWDRLIGRQTFDLSQPGQIVQVKFKLKRPPLNQPTTFVNVLFQIEGNPQSKAQLQFALIPDSAPLLLPPGADCGTWNAHAIAAANEADQSPSTWDQDDPGKQKILLVGDTTLQGIAAASHLANAALQLIGNCLPTNSPDNTMARTRIELIGRAKVETHVYPNDTAQAGWNPEWTGTLRLYGDPARFSYKADLLVEATNWLNVPSECDLKVDDFEPTSIPLTNVNNPAQSYPVHYDPLPPGEHPIRLTCTTPGARWFASGNESRSEHIYIDVTVTRIDKEPPSNHG
jgi:hypothetical protein